MRRIGVAVALAVLAACSCATTELEQRHAALRYQEARQAHPDWSEGALQAVAWQRVLIGMTGEQAQAAWGSPVDISRSVVDGVTHELWVYSTIITRNAVTVPHENWITGVSLQRWIYATVPWRSVTLDDDCVTDIEQ